MTPIDSQAKIFVRNLRLYAYHGVMPQERCVGGDYLVTVEVTADIRKAAETDRVEDTISYASLVDIIKDEMKQPSALIEHVAARIANSVVTRHHLAKEVEVEIVKVNPPMGADCEGAGVRIHLINDKTV